MITVKKINKEKVNCIKLKKNDELKVKGVNLFEEIYANIFLLARKKSGKTTLLWNILRKCSDADTRIIIFSATVQKDANMKAIVKYFKKKKNTVETYMSIFDDDGRTNILDALIEEMGELDDDDDSSDEENDKKKKKEKLLIDTGDEEKERPKRKKKYQAPEIIFVFDDLSTELRNPVISRLLKTNRHYKSKVILSSQYVHDLAPQSIRQLDYLLAFKGLSDEKLLKLHTGLDLSIPFDLFNKIYKDATKAKFQFLYIDAINQSLRKSFNCQYNFSS